MTKLIRLLNKQLDLQGVSEDDPYYNGLSDGMEATFSTLCHQFLPKNGTALDIGANIGVTSAILSEVAPLGVVHAFEPNPDVFSVLARNIKKNDLNVTAHQTALGDAAGTVRFAGDSAYGHVSADGVSVACDTVDAVVARLRLDRVDFIKIDVEGFEWRVLKGAQETISRFKPVICMEFNSWCLTAFGDVNIVAFADWLFAKFPVVCVANLPLQPMTNPMSFVHDHMIGTGCVQDLILAFDATAIK